MKLAKRQSSGGGNLATLSRRNKKRRLELEGALIESQFDALDLVNPNDAYLDPTTGETWLPLGVDSNVDILTAPFRNEIELRMIRQRARITALKNPYAKNLLNSVAVLTVGKGHKYTRPRRSKATRKPGFLRSNYPRRFNAGLINLSS